VLSFGAFGKDSGRTWVGYRGAILIGIMSPEYSAGGTEHESKGIGEATSSRKLATVVRKEI